MGQDSVLVVEVDKSDPKAGLDTVQDKKDMETTPKLGLDYDEHNKDKGVIGSDPIVGLESKSNWLDEDRKLTDRVFEDISNMGFNCSPKIIESKEEFGASKHALPLSAIQSERENVELVLVGVEEEDCSDSSEEDVNFCNAERVFFPEFEQKKDLKRRFGSLMRFQDKNHDELMDIGEGVSLLEMVVRHLDGDLSTPSAQVEPLPRVHILRIRASKGAYIYFRLLFGFCLAPTPYAVHRLDLGHRRSVVYTITTDRFTVTVRSQHHPSLAVQHHRRTWGSI
ncbi:hypothetical protein V6N12_005409 [Hibiscus sabdariffa]|uniref:Uncharacterized protein n=1 Tax=Hibiscus sabdariffa TaxID=183260 RepID=A0ABR2A5Z2_9ROSI